MITTATVRTNIPKEIMELEDFPFPRGGNPHISQKEVLRYLQNYACEFNLKPHIHFHKRVINVEPHGNGEWLIKIEDVKTKTICDELFDAVMVCNGHFFTPSIPKVEGIETFSGRYIHSHDYRARDDYSEKKVLVIGAGPSGLDISQQIAEVAERVRFFLSLLTGNAKIPTKDFMLDEIHRDVTRTGGEIVYKAIHKIGLRQKNYFDDMADVADIRRIPDVVHQIYFSALERRKENPGKFHLSEEQIELILRSAKEVTNYGA